MRKLLLSLLAFGALAQVALAQGSPTCDGTRYLTPIATLTSHTEVDYGSNVKQDGTTQILKMDIFTPVGDNVTQRPLLLLAHGGSFVGGSKADADVVYLCNYFAKLGYVTASMEYRLGVNFLQPDSVELTRAVVRSVHDMRAAIRFFMKDVAINGNTYGIDTQYIFIGGSSAGAIAALHTAYLNDFAETPQYVDDIINAMGGMAGNSGNAGYKTPIKGVVNLSGCLSEKTFMTAGEPPVVSLHGTADDIVPYGHQMLIFSSFFPIKVIDGSGSLHPYAVSLGIDSRLYTWQGAGHSPYAASTAYMDTTVDFVRPFLYEKVCGITTAITPDFTETFQVYPNPASHCLVINNAAENAQLLLMDVTGRILHTQTLVQGENTIATNAFPKGIYSLQLEYQGKQVIQKIVIE